MEISFSLISTMLYSIFLEKMPKAEKEFEGFRKLEPIAIIAD